MTGRSDYEDAHVWYGTTAAVRRLTRALRALARHALELRAALDDARSDVERLRSEARLAETAAVERWRARAEHMRALGWESARERDAALARAEQAERERDEARAALSEALDGWEALAEDTSVCSRDDYASIARLRKLLGADVPACPTCPGRAACACPPGEMCEGSVAP